MHRTGGDRLIIKTLDKWDFRNAFEEMNRKDNFSIDGLDTLFSHIENDEEETGTPYELDVIAICCEYTEYKDLTELQENYSDITSMEDLEEHTTVIPIEGTERFIIQNY